jgi:hypothetical protein
MWLFVGLSLVFPRNGDYVNLANTPMTPAPYLVLDYDPWGDGGPLSIWPYLTLESARAATGSGSYTRVWEWRVDVSGVGGGSYVVLE